MAYHTLPIESLTVNPANDRHGELENETAAISQLFAMRERHMRRLAEDLVETGEIFEPPLVYPEGDKFVVADGNRRTTCLKLLHDPKRAPTTELQAFFSGLKDKWQGDLPRSIECQIETNKDRIDEILLRRHVGVQGGRGQSTWDDRMKNNFVIRTGKSQGINVADEIEKHLNDAGIRIENKIPRSNLNRLLSSEALRNRIGVSAKQGKFKIIRNKDQTLHALHRIAIDLSNKIITLDDIWDTESKLRYIDDLEREGILPTLTPDPAPAPAPPRGPKPPKPSAPKPSPWPHLIPDADYKIAWTARLQRHRAIWEELQHRLDLKTAPNAISVLFRVLLEISTDNYIKTAKVANITQADRLSKKVAASAKRMHELGKIDKKYLSAIEKLKQSEEIISIDTLNRYVHSSNFSVSTSHLLMMWNTLSDYIVICLTTSESP